MKDKWHIYCQNVIKGHNRSFLARLLRTVLFIPSLIFRILMSCRNWAYDRRIFGQFIPPAPLVISIGNIVAGGTGKTPVTLMLAEEFCPSITIAILARGYRAPAGSLPTPTMVSKGHGPLHPAVYCGDEPYLLAKNLPKAFVIVGKDRRQGAMLAASNGAEILLLDDGMQHRKLARDFEIIVINAQDPFGKGHFLPRGLLRESKRSLSRANLIIINHVRDKPHYQQIVRQLAPYTSAPFVGTRIQIPSIIDLHGNAIDSIKGKSIGMFCGIANPESFHQTICDQGAEVVGSLILPDHRGCHMRRLQHFARESLEKGASLLLCTEKDAVKLDPNIEFPLPIVWLKLRLAIVEDCQNWKNFIKKAKAKLM